MELGLKISKAGPEKSRLKMGALSSKAKYSMRSIANKYREGKVKSIPMREMKQYLKPYANEELEPRLGGVTACFL